ncbi:MAG: monomeric sarcosine oxidase [Pseudonocardiales bacterium]|nr:MAG: monomeric sarcosine oxidase [Pseudonocardiales bacterium]
MTRLPEHARFVIIGAGIHGLSTAWHLGELLTARGEGSGRDILVLDKADVGAGASGIACGVVRNNYFQPAMRELMAHSVGVWESDPQAFSYHPVGYLQISPEVMHADVASIHAQQQAIGYDSTFVEGAEESARYLESIFSDWQAKNITSVLHERRGGYANNKASIHGLAAKARAAGVRIHAGVRVTDLVVEGSGVHAVQTDAGTIRCDTVVVAVGPWVRDFWAMLNLAETVPVVGHDGQSHQRPMWTYWSLQEGTLGVDPSFLTDNRGGMPPVVHVDTDAPLYDDIDGSLVTDRLWGIYFKPDFNFGGVQGGAMPFVVDRPTDQVAVDPYGPASPDFVVGADFARMWTAGLAHCLKRFAGKRELFSKEPSGGIGCFTPDSFPVFDVFRENAYVIADSNHGYKMIGVGALVAEELLGTAQPLLEPFRFSRYAAGRLHPQSNSPFPWS